MTTLILLAILAYPLARAIYRYIQRRENAFYLARTRALHNEAVGLNLEAEKRRIDEKIALERAVAMKAAE